MNVEPNQEWFIGLQKSNLMNRFVKKSTRGVDMDTIYYLAKNMSIMYKIVSAKNPDFINKQFRIFTEGHNHGYQIVIFDGDVKQKRNFVKQLECEDVFKFFKDNEIKYQIDKEYGKSIIESYERKVTILRNLYEVLPDGIIDPISISVCKSTGDQINFKMEPSEKVEQGNN